MFPLSCTTVPSFAGCLPDLTHVSLISWCKLCNHPTTVQMPGIFLFLSLALSTLNVQIRKFSRPTCCTMIIPRKFLIGENCATVMSSACSMKHHREDFFDFFFLFLFHFDDLCCSWYHGLGCLDKMAVDVWIWGQDHLSIAMPRSITCNPTPLYY